MKKYILIYRYFTKESQTKQPTKREYEFEASSDMNACIKARRFLGESEPGENASREHVRLLKIIPFMLS